MSDIPTIHRTELVDLLRASVGEEKASSLVFDAAIELGYGTFEYTEEQALEVLSVIAEEPGLVGIAAGLAKTRIPRLAKQRAS